jgi:hypothetical protein
MTEGNPPVSPDPKVRRAFVCERRFMSWQEPIITVYYCSCGNYYGSSTMGELHKMAVMAPSSSEDAGQVRHMRSKCPRCGKNRIKRFARLIPVSDVAAATAEVMKTLPKAPPRRRKEDKEEDARKITK